MTHAKNKNAHAGIHTRNKHSAISGPEILRSTKQFLIWERGTFCKKNDLLRERRKRKRERQRERKRGRERERERESVSKIITNQSPPYKLRSADD